MEDEYKATIARLEKEVLYERGKNKSVVEDLQ